MTMNEDSTERSDSPVRPDPDEKLLSDEEAAAARDARNIGGPPPEYEDEDDRPADQAMRPLYESGEGVDEGFQLAEDDLEETASHEENRYSPEGRNFGDEESAGDADVVDGEADAIPPEQ